MTKPDKGLELLETPEGFVVRTSSRKAYLLTFYTPARGKSVVLLQASHDPTCLQFATLEQAIAYLENEMKLSQFQKEEP
jgi:hypothetical protein